MGTLVYSKIENKFSPTLPHPHWGETGADRWSDWVWQQQNRVRTLDQLAEVFHLTAGEVSATKETRQVFQFAVTPYYLSLMDPENPDCPIRRQAIPQPGELKILPQELLDPSKEDSMTPAPGIVHRYPDRALLYTTHHCAVYCRFCTRKRKVSDPESAMTIDDLGAGIAYIKKNSAIREVVVSGGDALSNSDDRLNEILTRLYEIEHLEIIRIGSRNLVTLPFRITDKLASILAKFQPLFFHTHFNHPKECTREALEACARLVDRGIPINNHTVLLRGVNDSVEVMRELNLKLLMMRIKPYYLYQCDQVFGNSDFRTTIKKGLEIMQGLRGWSSGLAVPQYVVDTPGGGKVPLLPNYVRSMDETKAVLTNYRGNDYEYYFPPS